MKLSSILIYVGKVLAVSAAFVVGFMVGGMLATGLNLTQPPLPEGFEDEPIFLYMVLEAPIFAVLLAGIARNLAGGFWSRALSLTALTWIANYVNNQIEATFFASMGSGFLFTVVTFLVPSALLGLTTAWLFPYVGEKESFGQAMRSFFSGRSGRDWAWRIPLASLSFMPIYYFFGLLVIPFTRDYYVRGDFGLEIPSLSVLLPVLLLRTFLFALVCLPVIAAWRGSRRGLALWLGATLFFLVGLQSLLIAVWMPLGLRVPHMLEIMADEFCYAAVLAWLLWSERTAKAPAPAIQQVPGGAGVVPGR